MEKAKSCIVRHFNHYRRLSDDEATLLQTLEASPQDHPVDRILWREDDAAGFFYTVRSGWLCSFRDLTDGSRQVLDLFLPGDIVGLREFAFNQRLSGVFTLTDATICAFPMKRLLEVFRTSPDLTATFFAMTSRQQALLIERLVDLGRRSARAKVAHFLAEMYIRLQRTDPNLGEEIRLPVSQHVIADLLGLSPVHISRVFSQLRDDGIVFRDREIVRIPKFDRLAQEGDFSPKYLEGNLRNLSAEYSSIATA